MHTNAMKTLLVRALFSLPTSMNYNRQAVDPGVMLAARVFNLAVAPTLKNHSRLAFRKRMDDFGLGYVETGMVAGHIFDRSQGGLNKGMNLFAQHTLDDKALGDRIATDEELFYYWRLEGLSPGHWTEKRAYNLDTIFEEVSHGVGVWPEHGKWTLMNTSSVLERVDEI
jgi:hypothetical protein